MDATTRICLRNLSNWILALEEESEPKSKPIFTPREVLEGHLEMLECGLPLSVDWIRDRVAPALRDLLQEHAETGRGLAERRDLAYYSDDTVDLIQKAYEKVEGK